MHVCVYMYVPTHAGVIYRAKSKRLGLQPKNFSPSPICIFA